MIASGEIPSSSDISNSSKDSNEKEVPEEHGSEVASNKRKFEEIDDNGENDLPAKHRHIRESSRLVREDFYQTMAALSGTGMSIAEATSAVVIVGKGMFGTNWKDHEESDVMDVDTLPSKKAIRNAYKLMEAQSLSLVVDEVEKRKEEGRMITHAMDSTTKKGAGQFAVAGLHIGRDNPFPLPILSIHGEITDEIAMQVGLLTCVCPHVMVLLAVCVILCCVGFVRCVCHLVLVLYAACAILCWFSVLCVFSCVFSYQFPFLG